MKYKPSKTDIVASEKELLETDRKHILNSAENEFIMENHFKINNTNLSANKVAKMIKERFSL
jgi:hypothetical protein